MKSGNFPPGTELEHVPWPRKQRANEQDHFSHNFWPYHAVEFDNYGLVGSRIFHALNLIDESMHLSLTSLRGAPRDWCGGIRGLNGDFATKFLPLWWGKCGDLEFWMPYSRGEYGDFASVQLRGDWERSIVRSIDGKMVEEKKNRRYVFYWTIYICHYRDRFRTVCKLLRIERVNFL